jgi:hypothetical protein
VQVGTASFVRPDASAAVVAGLRAFLSARGIARLGDWRGVLAPGGRVPAAEKNGARA